MDNGHLLDPIKLRQLMIMRIPVSSVLDHILT